MNCPVKDETYLCETPCTDKCAYYEGAREFAEWLKEKYKPRLVINNQHDRKYVSSYPTINSEDIDNLLAEWQKGAENELSSKR